MLDIDHLIQDMQTLSNNLDTMADLVQRHTSRLGDLQNTLDEMMGRAQRAATGLSEQQTLCHSVLQQLHDAKQNP